MVKKGLVLLKVGEYKFMSPGKGKRYRGVYSVFVFVQEQLDISRGKLRTLIV